MDHPNIAKVFDAGTTSTGRPYFVMELVRGIPITQFCDQKELTIEDRLKLFVKVCQGVQHAHQKGIIHRDLSPKNVLVTEHDGVPVPKVIDFGIAKITQQTTPETAALTRTQQFIGTPAYMSPEQATTMATMDTRSDVYSLGVLLYELLTGQMPVKREKEPPTDVEEIRRRIREDDPLKPSARFRHYAADKLEQVAQCRGAVPQQLTNRVKGELDWIVMKVLEKDRIRRYQTANDLASDIRRHLRNEPVSAAAPSALYIFQKFARRHKASLATAAAIAVSLLVGLAISVRQAIRATKAERLAAVEAENAKSEARINQEIIEFINQVFSGQARPMNPPDREMKLRTMLDVATVRLEGRFVERPLVEAGIRNTIGLTYRRLGDYESAKEHMEMATSIRLKMLGGDHIDTIESTGNLAMLLTDLKDFNEAEMLTVDALEASQKRLGSQHPKTLELVNNLANLYLMQGREAKAEPLLSENLETTKRILGREHPNALLALQNWISIRLNQGATEDLDAPLRELIDLNREVLGATNPRTLESMALRSRLKFKQGNFAKAIELIREVLNHKQSVLGSDHPQTWDTLVQLALMLAGQNQWDQLENEVLDQLPSAPHDNYVIQMGYLMAWHGRHQEVISISEEIVRRAPYHHHNWYAVSTMYLAIGDLERYQKACEEMLVRFGDTSVPIIAERVAKTCLRVDRATTGSKTEQAFELAELAFSQVNREAEWLRPWLQLTGGIAALRNGDYFKAIGRLRRSRKSDNDYCRVKSWMFIAIAEHYRGQQESARNALGEAEALLATFPKAGDPDVSLSYLNDLMMAQVIYQEARTLIRIGDLAKATTR